MHHRSLLVALTASIFLSIPESNLFACDASAFSDSPIPDVDSTPEDFATRRVPILEKIKAEEIVIQAQEAMKATDGADLRRIEQELERAKKVIVELQMLLYEYDFLHNIAFSKNRVSPEKLSDALQITTPEVAEVMLERIVGLENLPVQEIQLVAVMLEELPGLRLALANGKGKVEIIAEDLTNSEGMKAAVARDYAGRYNTETGGIQVFTNHPFYFYSSDGSTLIHELVHLYLRVVMSENRAQMAALKQLHRRQLSRAGISARQRIAVTYAEAPSILKWLVYFSRGVNEITYWDVMLNKDLTNKYFARIEQIDIREYLTYAVEAYVMDKVNAGTMALKDKDPELFDFIEATLGAPH